jgi:ABC-type glycerol-3-phosphate transport system substrate-binding protein
MVISETLAGRFSLPVLVLFSLFVGFVTGCRAAPPVPQQPHSAAGTPTSGPINLVLWHSETGSARSELETLARAFHGAYPNLTVTPQYVGNEDDLNKQVTAAVALGRTPDLALANRRDIAQFARQGGLVPLDRFKSDPSVGLSADDIADFFPGILDEGTFAEFHKRPYAFPFDAEGLVLFYNTDSLKAAAYTQPPSNWNDFADMASKLTTDQQYGWAMQIDADVFSAMLVSRGSAMLDDPERRSLFEERGGVAAMTLVSQLTKSGAAQVKSDHDAALNDFAQGRAAFYFDWMTELSVIQNAQKSGDSSFAIGISNLPQADPTETYVLQRGYDFGIFKTTADRENNAWFFIRWITASRQTAQWARLVGAIPLRASALPFLAGGSLTDTRLREIEDSFGGIAPRFVPRSANRHAQEIEHLMEEAWTQIALSKADVVTTLTASASSADQLLGVQQ